MTVHALIRAAAAASAIALGSCGSLANPELVRPGAVVNAIEIRNVQDRPVTDLRIGICGQTLGFGPDYGFDRLNGNHIRPGDTRRFPASPGCYNIAVLVGGGFLSSGAEHFGVINVSAEPGEVAVWYVP